MSSAGLERRIATAATLGLALLLGACHRPPPGPPAVAKVGGEPVLTSELKAELDRVRIESEAEVRPEGEALERLRRAVLDGIVERKLLLAEAQRQGVTVSDKELDEAMSRRHLLALDGAEPQKEPLSPEMLRQKTREQVVIERLLLKDVAARVALGADEAKSYYDAHQEEFTRGEQLRVSQIFIPKREPADAEARSQAEAVRRELNRGTDFAKLAQKHSASPDARQGGDLGWFARGTMPPEFDDVCFKLKKGQITDPVETPYGFHLFKLVDRRDAQVPPFAQVEQAISLKLRREAVARAQAAYVERLRQKAGVELVEAEIAKVF